MNVASDLLRLLGDETRLRLLRVLARESLNVSELTAILGVAQSGVSRHLGLLKDAGLVTEQRTGIYAWYALNPTLADAAGPHAALWAWLTSHFAGANAKTKADDARLAEVRRVRRESFQETHGEEDKRQLVPGRSWAAWSRALGLLLPPLDVADLGCGEGYLTIEAARWARHVIAVDQSADVLARAKAMGTRRGVKNITWKRGELERVPIGDAAVDVAVLCQALHHADDPAAALAEAHRIMRPGGKLLLLDLRRHNEAWVRQALGDRWLGFEDGALHDLLAAAGFSGITVRAGASRAGDPFAVLIASGIASGPRPSPSASRKGRP